VRGAVWRAKYRLPDGREVHKTIGPVWSERGRPRAGYFTKRTAEACAAAGEQLRYVEQGLNRKPSTLANWPLGTEANRQLAVKQAAPLQIRCS
jgi:hypothetical protein